MPAFARSCTTSGWGWRFSRGRSPVLPDRDRDDIAGEVTKPPRSSINWECPPPDYRVSAEVALDFELCPIDANPLQRNAGGAIGCAKACRGSSRSFGATEETFPDAASILALRSAFKNAREHHVTVLAASGDLGATNWELNLSDIYPMRVNSWPSSDPLVTSVGGSQLTLDDCGSWLAPVVVWNGFGGSDG